MPAGAARRIDADLRRLPLLYRENKHLRVANRTLGAKVDTLRSAIASKDTVIATGNRRLAGEKSLRADATHRAKVAEGKAKGRFWLLVGETAAIVGVVIVEIVTHIAH